MFKLIFPIGFSQLPIYHASMICRIIITHKDTPSFDGYAFHKLVPFGDSFANLRGGMDKFVCPCEALQYTENMDKQSLSMPPNSIKNFERAKHQVKSLSQQRIILRLSSG
jgi:hypothetical protein